MNKLLCIEKSLHRHFPLDTKEKLLSRYMSFKFVHGNHIDVKHASLELFDAVPGKIYLQIRRHVVINTIFGILDTFIRLSFLADVKRTDRNDSGIVVVYLDRKMTFEMVCYTSIISSVLHDNT